MPIQVVYHFNNPWERDWIDQFLAPYAEIEHIVDTKRQIRDENVIYVNPLRNKSDLDFLATIGSKGRVGLFHSGDEHYSGYYQAYNYCNAVARTYHAPHLANERVRQVSLFTSKAFQEPIAEAAIAGRPHVWGFIGRLHVGGRDVMANTLSKEFDGFLSQSQQWGDTANMSQTDYRSALERFIFAPCPAGNVMADTIRLYEALQCGCIPIVYHRKHFNYFRQFYGDTPLIYVSDWADAPKIMRALLSDPHLLEEKAAVCREWWKATKSEMSQRYVSFLEDFKTGPKLGVERLLLRGALTRTVTYALNSDKPARNLLRRLGHEVTVPALRRAPSIGW